MNRLILTSGPDGPADLVQVRGRTRAASPLPNALEEWPEIARVLRGRRLALFLDYDGTLTPIAARPELAVLPAGMRSTLGAVGRRWPTAIVSGRALDDLERLVALDHLAYAGSHGFAVRAPGGLGLEAAPATRDQIRQAVVELRQRTAGVAGALVEDKHFSAALHHRLVARRDLPAVKRAFEHVLQQHPGLRAFMGDRLLELRPDVHWDKDAAVAWLLRFTGLSDAVTIYIGQDPTNEEAFRALRARGFTILVGPVPCSTNAALSLREPSEVQGFLLRLACLPGLHRRPIAS